MCDTGTGLAADVFSFHAVAGDQLLGQLAFLNLDGDLDVALRGPCVGASCPNVEEFDSFGGGEVIDATIPESGDYILEVTSKSVTANVPYNLVVGLWHTCSADPFESNDAPHDARAVSAAGLSGAANICGSPGAPDYDFFEFTLAPGDTLITSADFEHYHGDIDLFLMRDGVVVDSAASDGDGEFLNAPIEEGAVYYLLVATSDLRNTPYDLSITLNQAPCDDDIYEPNDSYEEPLRITPGVYGGLVHCPQSEDWYELDLTLPANLAVTVSAQPEVATDDLRIDVYRPSGIAPEGRVLFESTAGDNPDVMFGETPVGVTGPYRVRVYQREGAIHSGPVPYELVVSKGISGVCLADRAEPNDERESATRIYGNGEVVASACEPDWYLIHLFEGQTLTVTLDAEDGLEDGPDVAIFADTASPLALSSSTTFTRVGEQGDYFIRVRDHDSEAHYRLTTEVDATVDECPDVDPGEDDDSAGDAAAFDGAVQGRLCDDGDYLETALARDESHTFELFFDSSRGAPTVDLIDDGSIVSSGLPAADGLLRGEVLWDSDANAVFHIEANGYTGPYQLAVRGNGACTVDDVGGNDRFATATRLDEEWHDSRWLCPTGDVDFFRFDGSTGGFFAAQAEVRENDIRLDLYDDGGRVVMSANGSSLAEAKEAVWAEIAPGAAYRVAVSATDALPARFNLRLQAHAGDECTDSGTNRTFDNAEDYPLGVPEGDPVLLTVCRGAGDWWKSDEVLPADSVLTATVTVPDDAPRADLDVALYDSLGTLLGVARTLENTEVVEVTLDASTVAHVHIFVADGNPGTEYELYLTVAE